MNVAFAWGDSPLEFAARPREERLLMIAHYTASQKIDIWASEVAEHENAALRRNQDRFRR